MTYFGHAVQKIFIFGGNTSSFQLLVGKRLREIRQVVNGMKLRAGYAEFCSDEFDSGEKKVHQTCFQVLLFSQFGQCFKCLLLFFFFLFG